MAGKSLIYVKNEFIKKEKSKMILWCLKDNELSKKFYAKIGRKIIHERLIQIGDRFYQEVYKSATHKDAQRFS